MELAAEEIAAAVEAAVADHRAGRLDAAEQGYRAVLQADPDNLRATYNLGLVLVRRKDFDAALPLLAHAVEVAPSSFPAWSGYAEGLIAAERFAEAERLLGPHRAGPRGAPLELRLRQAWGLALMAERRSAEAVAQLSRAADLAPEDPEAHSDLALALVRSGQSEAALTCFERALALDPGHLAARVNAGAALKDLGRADEAEAAWREVLAGDPANAAAARNLHGLLIEQGRFREALEQAEAGLQIGKSAERLRARGVALHNLGRYADALACFEPLLEAPEFRYEAQTLVGLVLWMLGRRDEALGILDEAIAEAPEKPLAYYRRSFIRLQQLDFEGGWRDYEKRLDIEEFMAWAGVLTPEVRAHLAHDPTLQSVQGKRVLLVAEQGIGDQVMFASMLPDLEAVAGGAAIAVTHKLMRLFRSSFPDVDVLLVPGAQVRVSDYDAVLGMGSLGRIWRNRLADFPGAPYLAPRLEVSEAWAKRLGPRPAGLRIGVSWRGGTARTGTQRRSLELDELARILTMPGCEVFSLQYGEVEAEVAAANARLGADIKVFPAAQIEDFEDLAGLVQNLDVVVSVQTALVHLCGAIGQECLTLVPRNPEWRYTLTGSTMPWYGSVRIFRQSDAGAWDPAIGEIAQVLQGRLSA